MSAGHPQKDYARSDESLAFEAFWRALCRDRAMPERNDFRPSQALRFLRHLVITEAPAAANTMRIRYVGEWTHEIAGRNLAGCDYLELLPPDFHDDAVATARLIVGQPCGLWQVSPLHLARGYAQCAEMTILPLAANGNNPPCMLTLVRPTEGLFLKSLPVSYGLAVDTARAFRFLDLGAGAPAWPLAA